MANSGDDTGVCSKELRLKIDEWLRWDQVKCYLYFSMNY